ncbi:thiamine-monophosphate kinase [Altererythrobacter atlanticus]|nr:thiamine-monophosphate kinase [Croceibacterium atlanticum]
MMEGETDFIQMMRALAHHPAARGLSDDAAVLEIGTETLILTHDMMVEGVHYLPDQDMADVAWKLVACNASDLAAKGARPVGALVGAMLGSGNEAFALGLGQALNHFGLPLLGGDTVSGGPPRSFGLTAIGRATHIPVPSRSGAKPGDQIFVTGPLGAAMMGFEALRDGTGADSTAYRRPQARLAEGQALAPFVSAMMDISDGLLLDGWRMAKASDVSLAIDSAAVPIAAPEERRWDALRWGDDYELLFTLPPETEPPVPAARIGTVEPAGFASLFVDGEPVTNSEGLGYQH